MDILTLTEPQLEFVQQYLNLLDVVEEGLELVDLNYQERNYGTGDQLLNDLIHSFNPFQQSNRTMQSIFLYEHQVFQQLHQFQSIVEQVEHIKRIFHNELEKHSFIHEFFLPAYLQWKTKMYSQIQAYMVN